MKTNMIRENIETVEKAQFFNSLASIPNFNKTMNVSVKTGIKLRN